MSRMKNSWTPDVLRALRAVQTKGVAVGEDVRDAMVCSRSKAYRIFKVMRDLRLLERVEGEPETWRLGPRSKAWMEFWGLRL